MDFQQECDARRDIELAEKQLAARIANLCDQDDWPERLYSRLTANEALEHIKQLDGDVREELSAWVDRAANESRAIGNESLWAACPAQFRGEFAKASELLPIDKLEKAMSIVANYIPQKQHDGANDWQPSDLEHEAALEWAEDVVSTHEAGGDLRANGGTLLNVPEQLREYFDWEAAEVAALNDKLPTLNDDSTGDNLSPKKPRNRAEALRWLLDRIPSAVSALDVAERLVAEREAALKSAKKILDAEQENLHALNREYVRVLDGGDYQQLLPFEDEPQAEQVATQPSPSPVAADPIAGEPVAVLVADQLSVKTNGKSDGVGIPQGTVDLLVDASLGTIGLLEEHMRKHGEFWAKGLKGIGPGKADKITAALGVLRQCFPADAGPLEELILDEAAYQLGVLARRAGKPRDCAYCETGHQGRSWIKGYDDAASMEGGE